jgi:hypothetical protein
MWLQGSFDLIAHSSMLHLHHLLQHSILSSTNMCSDATHMLKSIAKTPHQYRQLLSHYTNVSYAALLLLLDVITVSTMHYRTKQVLAVAAVVTHPLLTWTSLQQRQQQVLQGLASGSEAAQTLLATPQQSIAAAVISCDTVVTTDSKSRAAIAAEQAAAARTQQRATLKVQLKHARVLISCQLRRVLRDAVTSNRAVSTKRLPKVLAALSCVEDPTLRLEGTRAATAAATALRRFDGLLKSSESAKLITESSAAVTALTANCSQLRAAIDAYLHRKATDLLRYNSTAVRAAAAAAAADAERARAQREQLDRWFITASGENSDYDEVQYELDAGGYCTEKEDEDHERARNLQYSLIGRTPACGGLSAPLTTRDVFY